MRKSFKKFVASFLTLGLSVGLLNASVSFANTESTDPTATPVAEGTPIDKTNFPDLDVYASASYADMRGNKDQILTTEEAKAITSLYLSNSVNLQKYLQIFTSLQTLSVSMENETSLTVPDNITSLSIRSKANSVVNVNGGKNISSVYYHAESNANLDFTKSSGYNNVTSISISGQKISDITLPNQAGLKDVFIPQSSIKKINLSKHKKLTSFVCYKGKLKSLNISANKTLTSLTVTGNNLTKIDTSKNKNLNSLNLIENKLTKIDTSKNKKLKYLSVGDNKLKSINLQKNKNLVSFGVEKNKLSKINVAALKNLESLTVNDNKLKTLDISKNKKLSYLNCNNNKLTKIKAKKSNKITYLAVSGNKFKTFSLANYKKVTNFNVGKTYSLLKKIGFNQKLALVIQVSPNKTHNLKKYLPKMKGCTFRKNEFSYDDGCMNITESGKLSFDKAKISKMGYKPFYMLQIVKGGKPMPLTISVNNIK